MPEELSTQIQAWANVFLVWVGFGTIVGLLAKAIMPGRDPGGAVATLAMGIGGTIIGCGVVTYFNPGTVVTPISPLGLAVATAGAFVILFFYKLLSGYWFIEGDRPRWGYRQRRRRRRHYAYEDD
ncbi:MAG: GlsB/YeaQ/YmgE family stress response membrane protein [Planctomycetales bacterium]|nr:GlsB/YeaQ/YmgE family stress response membrane protein [Planctomycetales bacterium]